MPTSSGRRNSAELDMGRLTSSPEIKIMCIDKLKHRRRRRTHKGPNNRRIPVECCTQPPQGRRRRRLDRHIHHALLRLRPRTGDASADRISCRDVCPRDPLGHEALLPHHRALPAALRPVVAPAHVAARVPEQQRAALRHRDAVPAARRRAPVGQRKVRGEITIHGFCGVQSWRHGRPR